MVPGIKIVKIEYVYGTLLPQAIPSVQLVDIRVENTLTSGT